MRYFESLRVHWIVEMIGIYGFINRGHVMRKFDVTAAVASKDFRTVMKSYPDLMEYDVNWKCYVEKEKC